MPEDSTEEEDMRRQERMKVMKDMMKKIRSKGRMDAENRWWVAELLAADREKTWIHPEDEDSMQKFSPVGKWKRKMMEERWKNCTNKG